MRPFCTACAAQVGTAFALVLDVDFVPSPAARDALERAATTLGDRDCLVVPAFESRAAAPLPETLDALRAAYVAGDAEGFHMTRFGRGGYPAGHAPTDYGHWFSASDAYRVAYAEGYEPYVVARPETLPRFDARFRGYGLNKVAHAFALNANRFTFLVVPDAYVVAREHDVSDDYRRLYDRASDAYDRARRLEVQALYDRFKRETDTLHKKAHANASVSERPRSLDAAVSVSVSLAVSVSALFFAGAAFAALKSYEQGAVQLLA